MLAIVVSAGGSSEKENVMKKYILSALLVLPLAVAGVAYAKSSKAAPKEAAAYNCPLTGEDLPCPNCCPLNK